MNTRNINPVNRPAIVDEIIEQLLGFILKEQLKPGDKLPAERELMAQLSVGRSTLREAIKSLSTIGILEVKQGAGTFVGNGDMSILVKPLTWGLLLNQDSVDHVIEVRTVIETALAGWAAERATEAEIATLGDILESLEASQADIDAYVEHDLEFHLAIAIAAHNPMFLQILSLIQHMLRVWMKVTYMEESGGPADSMVLHRKIYEAIRSHDAQAAREFMQDHTSGVPLRLAATKKSINQQVIQSFLKLIT
jgi:GntR family transcriptional repressor for pyruvate dehydrogenase complex